MSKFGFVLILAALVLAGCSQQKTESYSPPALGEEWSVKMTLSGGIAGLLRTVEVRSDGRYTVTDERTGSVVDSALKETELTTLQGLVETLEFTTPNNPGVCADCFVYDLEIESEGKKMVIQSDDLSVGESGMGELVTFLRDLIDKALR